MKFIKKNNLKKILKKKNLINYNLLFLKIGLKNFKNF